MLLRNPDSLPNTLSTFDLKVMLLVKSAVIHSVGDFEPSGCVAVVRVSRFGVSKHCWISRRALQLPCHYRSHRLLQLRIGIGRHSVADGARVHLPVKKFQSFFG